jgi:serpin B
MTDAYSLAKADFSGMGEMASDQDNIHIGSVMHKTAMSVDENGTRAAAVTAIDAPGSPQPLEIRNVVFDRPFVCMIVERETGIPLFMGTVMDVQ